MGSELGFGRWPVGVVFKWVGMTKGLANLSSANPALWAMPGLNWRPLPCQGSALPLRQPPEVETGFEPVYTDLQSAASPLGHSTGSVDRSKDLLRADDGTRTRDPHLGKVMLYQLSHVRMLASGPLRSFRTLSFLLGDEKVL